MENSTQPALDAYGTPLTVEAVLNEAAPALKSAGAPHPLGLFGTKGLKFWTYCGDGNIEITLDGTFDDNNNHIVRNQSNNYSTEDSITHVEFTLFHQKADLAIKINGQEQWKTTFNGWSREFDDFQPLQAPIQRAGYYISIGCWAAGVDQQSSIYVNVTKSHPDWMGQIDGNTPLYKLCLPSAHDSGSNTMTNIVKIHASVAAMAIIIAMLVVVFPIVGGFIAAFATVRFTSIILCAGGMTQRSDVKTMLELGIRSFDFRPGYNIPGVKAIMGGIYHQHSLVPGSLASDFFGDIASWLDKHPSEIAVLNLSTAGFVSGEMNPEKTELYNILKDAVKNTSVLYATESSVWERTLNELRSARTRLIVMDNIWESHPSTDAWDENAWKTLDPSTMLARFKSEITPEKQAGHMVTYYQIQATATDVAFHNGAWAFRLVTTGDRNDLPLMATKGECGAKLIPYIINEGAPKLNRMQPIIIGDDWVDGSLTEACIEITRQRVARSQDNWVPN